MVMTLFLELQGNCTHLGLLKKARADQDELLAVLNGYIRPVLEYACQLWHTAITQKQCDQIERVQKRAFRIIFGSMYTSYNNVLSEFNLASPLAKKTESIA